MTVANAPRLHRHRDAANDPTAQIEPWIARRVVAGMAPRALVAATGGAISLRTAYRWRASIVRLEDVDIDGWRATFAIRRNDPPTRLSKWRRIES